MELDANGPKNLENYKLVNSNFLWISFRNSSLLYFLYKSRLRSFKVALYFISVH